MLINNHENINLQVEDITPYLNKNQWKIDKKTNDYFVYIAPIMDDDGNPIRLIVPKNNSLIDFNRRLLEVVSLISAVENRPTNEIITKIKNRDKDIFLIKINIGVGNSPSLPFEQTVRILRNIKQFLAYAASAEENPLPYFNKTLMSGKKFIDNCRFGHTFHGSFGFSIESPLEINPISIGENSKISIPTNRRIIERAMRGLLNAHEATIEGTPEIVSNAYQTGLNANMCESLAEIIRDAGEFKTEYSVLWSPEWPIDQTIKSVSVILDHKATPYLDSGARSMRSPLESEEITIQGTITQMRIDSSNTEDDEEEDGGGRYIVVSDRKTRRNIHIYLDIDEYRSACDAHRDSRDFVATGRLEKPGKYWHLMSPKNIHFSE